MLRERTREGEKNFRFSSQATISFPSSLPSVNLLYDREPREVMCSILEKKYVY